MNILQRYYGENFEYSIFYGTPSVDQKITIQSIEEQHIRLL